MAVIMGNEMQQKDEQLWRLKQVLERVPVSKSTWWNWVASGRAPKPVKLGQRTTCWKASEVYALISGEV